MDMNDDPVIVIVEDDPNIADLVELYLRRDGYRPYQASTGERALQVIAERNPELVLLDVGLRANSTASVSAAPSGPSPTFRSSSSPPAARRSIGSSGSNSVPTTMSPSHFRP